MPALSKMTLNQNMINLDNLTTERNLSTVVNFTTDQNITRVFNFSAFVFMDENLTDAKQFKMTLVQLRLGAGICFALTAFLAVFYAFVLFCIVCSNLYKTSSFYQQVISLGCLEITQMMLYMFDFMLTILLGNLECPITVLQATSVVEQWIRQVLACIWLLIAVNRLFGMWKPMQVKIIFSLRRSLIITCGCLVWAAVFLPLKSIQWIPRYRPEYFFRRTDVHPTLAHWWMTVSVLATTTVPGLVTIVTYAVCLFILFRKKCTGGNVASSADYTVERNLALICISLYSPYILRFCLFRARILSPEYDRLNLGSLITYWILEITIYGMNPVVYSITSSQIRASICKCCCKQVNHSGAAVVPIHIEPIVTYHAQGRNKASSAPHLLKLNAQEQNLPGERQNFSAEENNFAAEQHHK